MSVTVEHVSAVTRKCDGCGQEEMRTVLGMDPEFASLTWDKPWKEFYVQVANGLQRAVPNDACSRECFLVIAGKTWDNW